MSIKKLFLSLVLFPSWFATFCTHPFTVVLDPGTGYDPSFIQGPTTCLESVQNLLQDAFPEARIVLSRTAQEPTDHARVSSFSNRLQADLYISCNFVIQKDTAPELRVYTCFDKTQHTTSPKPSQSLTLIPAPTAYLGNQKESELCAHHFVEATKSKGSFFVLSPAALPLKALQGLLAPSFLIEVSAPRSRDWQASPSLLYEGVKAVMDHLLEKRRE